MTLWDDDHNCFVDSYVCRAFSAFWNPFTSTWGVAPGYYMSRLWRLKRDLPVADTRSGSDPPDYGCGLAARVTIFNSIST